MSSNIPYQPFETTSVHLCGNTPAADNVLLSHDQKYYPNTSLDENYIEFEYRNNRNYYIDLRQAYLALKVKTVKGRR